MGTAAPYRTRGQRDQVVFSNLCARPVAWVGWFA